MRKRAVFSVALVVMLWGCGGNSAITDFRTLTAEQVAEQIRERSGGQFTQVSLSPEGENRFTGTAVTKDNKTYQLTVTVTAKEISFSGKGASESISGSVTLSKR
ncbi:MAG: hypothetical protein NZM42_12995 [Gemmatales bacterium]|nr:hypothetical protein [Gemmatales bacterium]MDW8222802.1 hypothetical protein [Gemmatales bacterium]